MIFGEPTRLSCNCQKGGRKSWWPRRRLTAESILMTGARSPRSGSGPHTRRWRSARGEAKNRYVKVPIVMALLGGWKDGADDAALCGGDGRRRCATAAEAVSGSENGGVVSPSARHQLEISLHLTMANTRPKDSPPSRPSGPSEKTHMPLARVPGQSFKRPRRACNGGVLPFGILLPLLVRHPQFSVSLPSSGQGSSLSTCTGKSTMERNGR